MKCLFIGGPNDGHLQDLEYDPPMLEFFVREPMSARIYNPEEDGPVINKKVKIVRYLCQRWCPEKGVDRFIYVLEGLSGTEAFDKLIQGYKP